MKVARDDTGTSLVEVVIAATVGTLALAATYAVMWGFIDDVSVANDGLQAARESRPVMQALVIELREATPPNAAAAGVPVVGLSNSSITFATDRWAPPGPELVTYSLENCVENLCDLRRTAIAADADSVAPEWSYDDGVVVINTVVASGIVDPDVSGQPLFAGLEYVNGVATTTSACEAGTATPCAFPLVSIGFQLDPNAQRDEFRPYQLVEEVRMRNADQ